MDRGLDRPEPLAPLGHGGFERGRDRGVRLEVGDLAAEPLDLCDPRPLRGVQAPPADEDEAGPGGSQVGRQLQAEPSASPDDQDDAPLWERERDGPLHVEGKEGPYEAAALPESHVPGVRLGQLRAQGGREGPRLLRRPASVEVDAPDAPATVFPGERADEARERAGEGSGRRLRGEEAVDAPRRHEDLRGARAALPEGLDQPEQREETGLLDALE